MVASTQLYKRVCPFVRRSVILSLGGQRLDSEQRMSCIRTCSFPVWLFSFPSLFCLYFWFASVMLLLLPPLVNLLFVFILSCNLFLSFFSCCCRCNAIKSLIPSHLLLIVYLYSKEEDVGLGQSSLLCPPCRLGGLSNLLQVNPHFKTNAVVHHGTICSNARFTVCYRVNGSPPNNRTDTDTEIQV